MAIWCLYTADPTQHPIILGDVVLTGTGGDEETGDGPDQVVSDIFEAREFVVQVRPYGTVPDTIPMPGSTTSSTPPHGACSSATRCVPVR